MDNINFWNGNKSRPRQAYETALLRACLRHSEEAYGEATLQLDNNNYPLAEDESNIFEAGADIIVTVAGNAKFANKQKIIIYTPLTKGLLGYRLILVRNDCLDTFKNISTSKQLQALSIGVPDTWADAELFRQNNYQVVEQGMLETMFALLNERVFDYTALGVNEIEAIFSQHALPLGNISIEPSLMFYYPFPLVFYVNPRKPDLAVRVTAGLNAIKANGEFQKIFSEHHGDIVQRLNLQHRTIITLQNPLLPVEMADFESRLLV